MEYNILPMNVKCINVKLIKIDVKLYKYAVSMSGQETLAKTNN